ncbi:MAG TPA: antibiotic biosynthesis monooxygenase family protein [Actinomycetes bacterium]|nr:antibiotic biosynthesis monooxygenase family protein [Actinomycetes bacterium]
MSGALDRDEHGAPRTRLLPDRQGMVVRLQADAGGRTALLDALHRYIERLAEEPATEFFCISLDPDEPEVVWLHEWFIGEDGITAHRSAPAFADLMAELNTVLSTAPGVMRFVPLRLHLADGLWEDEPL